MGKKLSSKHKAQPPKPPVKVVQLEEQFFKELRQMTIDLFVSMGIPTEIQPNGKLKIKSRRTVAQIMDRVHKYAGFWQNKWHGDRRAL